MTEAERLKAFMNELELLLQKYHCISFVRKEKYDGPLPNGQWCDGTLSTVEYVALPMPPDNPPVEVDKPT